MDALALIWRETFHLAWGAGERIQCWGMAIRECGWFNGFRTHGVDGSFNCVTLRGMGEWTVNRKAKQRLRCLPPSPYLLQAGALRISLPERAELSYGLWTMDFMCMYVHFHVNCCPAGAGPGWIGVDFRPLLLQRNRHRRQWPIQHAMHTRRFQGFFTLSKQC